MGQAEARQALGDQPHDPDAVFRRPEQRHGAYGKDDHQQRHGTSRQQPLPGKQEDESTDADEENGRVRIAELSGNCHEAPEEGVSAAGDAKEFGKLRDADAQGRPGLEPEEGGLRDEVDDAAQAEEPGRYADEGDHCRRQGGDPRITGRVASGERPRDSGDHDGNGGGGTDGEMPGRGEQGVGKPAEKVAVESHMGGRPASEAYAIATGTA